MAKAENYLELQKKYGFNNDVLLGLLLGSELDPTPKIPNPIKIAEQVGIKPVEQIEKPIVTVRTQIQKPEKVKPRFDPQNPTHKKIQEKVLTFLHEQGGREVLNIQIVKIAGGQLTPSLVEYLLRENKIECRLEKKIPGKRGLPKHYYKLKTKTVFVFNDVKSPPPTVMELDKPLVSNKEMRGVENH